jgi:SAM-dependent methyltransferase
MDEYLQANRRMWDEQTPFHADSPFYDVAGFKAGRCTLRPVEIEEVGDVAGKSLLHLQCHFGLDTMSWARRGATATGVDFSAKSIELARSLAAELGLGVRFVCCDVYDLPRHLDGRFDVVFTSAGVLAWLPDLGGWADVIRHFLAPGGVFYLREFHPFADIFDDDPDATSPRIRYPYFHADEPMEFGPHVGTYACAGARIRTRSYEWVHPISDVVNALIGAGLRLEFLHEFPYRTYPSHPFLTRGDDGFWRYGPAPEGLPLMYSIRASRG